MVSIDIIKPLSNVLRSAVKKSQHYQEKNTWERQELNLRLLGEEQVCYLHAIPPSPSNIKYLFKIHLDPPMLSFAGHSNLQSHDQRFSNLEAKSLVRKKGLLRKKQQQEKFCALGGRKEIMKGFKPVLWKLGPLNLLQAETVQM